MKESISKNLKLLRKNKNLSQAGLGIALGVSRGTVSNWELGRRELTIHDATQIANYFHISLDELIHFEEREE